MLMALGWYLGVGSTFPPTNSHRVVSRLSVLFRDILQCCSSACLTRGAGEEPGASIYTRDVAVVRV